jgi:putative ABC transport system permease protein
MSLDRTPRLRLRPLGPLARGLLRRGFAWLTGQAQRLLAHGRRLVKWLGEGKPIVLPNWKGPAARFARPARLTRPVWRLLTTRLRVTFQPIVERTRATSRRLATPFRPRLVRFSFSAQMAWHGVVANPLRSGLTVLGVAIGVAAVVSLMGVGEGARQAVMRQFQSLGANVIVIRAEDKTVRFHPEEAEELVIDVNRLSMATPVVETTSPIKWRRTRGVGDLLGVNEKFPAIRDHPLVSGHFFAPFHVKQRSPVAVLGYNVAVSLMGGRSPVGQTFTMAGHTFRIIGVLAAKGEGAGDGIDNKIIIPYTTALQIAETRTVSEIWCKANSASEADLAVVQLGRIYKRRLGLDQAAPTLQPPGRDGSGNGGDGAPPKQPGGEPGGEPGGSALSGGKNLITITNLNRLVKEADKANRVMTLLLGGIAAVSLLVGGLGIMNIMLVAVSERTSEIGVRRALGAKQSDLVTQFLMEAFYLSGVGAVAGVAAGIWGAGLFERWGLQTAISPEAVLVAAFVAIGTGLLFGVYPAYAASSVPPVEALRR